MESQIDPESLPFAEMRQWYRKQLGYDAHSIRSRGKTRGQQIDEELRAQGYPGLPPADLSIGITVTEAARRHAERPEVKAKREEFFAAKARERAANKTGEAIPATIVNAARPQRAAAPNRDSERPFLISCAQCGPLKRRKYRSHANQEQRDHNKVHPQHTVTVEVQS